MKTYKRYWNESMETLTRENYIAVQEKALRNQLSYVWENSLFYKRKFMQAGVNPDKVKSLEDLELLPFTTKSELRDSQIASPPLGEHITCDKRQVKRIYSTSGTTGRPTFIGLTAKDVDTWSETACRAFWTCGLRSDSIVPLVVAPFLVAFSFADAIQKIGTVVPIGVGSTDRLIGAFQHIGANALLATSSFPLHFSASLTKRGIDPKSLGIRLIMAGGEPGAAIPSVRAEVEDTFGCRFLEMMGNGDLYGEMFAECENKNGMHFIAQGIVHPEIIDPESGKSLEISEGTRGELVLTSLERQCIPLVRFRTHDHVQVVSTRCGCGRTGFSIRVFGRTDEMIIVQGVNVYPSAVRDVVASFAPDTTGAMEIQLNSPPPEGWQPPIHIKVELRCHVADPDALKHRIESRIREKLIFRSAIEPVPEGSLPRFEYKAKLVRKLYEEHN
ncbi:MAG: phenylacetate--CoA ligase family protein [Pseudomonadota bacterium]